MAHRLLDQARDLNERIWTTNMRNLNTWPAVGLRAVRIVYAVGRDLAGGQLTLRAMSLVYTTLLSIVPLLALSFSVLKALGAHNQIEPMLFSFLEPLGDKGTEIGTNVMQFVENMKVGVLGSIGLAMLVYTVISLMHKIEGSFNYIWHINRPRGMGERFRDYLSVVVIGPVLVVSALGISASMMNSDLAHKIAEFLPFGVDILLMITRIIPYLMIIAAFTFIYLFIPNTKVKLHAALIGAVISGFMWETLGLAFASFAVSSTKYDAIYSSFAIMIMLLIWLHLCWLILLVGSNISYYVQHPTRAQIVRGKFRVNNQEKEQLALTIMLLICHKHLRGEQACSADELTGRIGVTGEAIDYVLDQLQKIGFIAPLCGEPTRYVPLQDPQSVCVADFLGSVRRAEDTLRMQIGGKESAEAVAAAQLARMDSALAELWAGQSLRDAALEVD